MGIVLHDVNEYVLELSVPGTQTQADHLEVNIVPYDGTIRGIFARLDTAGVTGTQTTDVLLNGTTIFSGATLINFATGVKVPTYGAFTVNPTVVKKGDTLRLNNTVVHSGTPAKSLATMINIRRGRASSIGTDTDSVSKRSDNV